MAKVFLDKLEEIKQTKKPTNILQMLSVLALGVSIVAGIASTYVVFSSDLSVYWMSLPVFIIGILVVVDRLIGILQAKYDVMYEMISGKLQKVFEEEK